MPDSMIELLMLSIQANMTQPLGQWKFCILVNFCLGPGRVCLTQCRPMEDGVLGSRTSRSKVLVCPHRHAAVVMLAGCRRDPTMTVLAKN